MPQTWFSRSMTSRASMYGTASALSPVVIGRLPLELDRLGRERAAQLAQPLPNGMPGGLPEVAALPVGARTIAGPASLAQTSAIVTVT
jgi:hypothetical protein